jgi:eukaryotic-like serine/threonine-protein kinase
MRDGLEDPPSPGSAEETECLHAKPRHPETIGEYRILRRIGEGGMGVVYEAEQQNPRRAVALKVIRGGAYVDDHAVRLFRREARALARLKHPGIAAIYARAGAGASS